ncbi:hypothetical protein ACFE04_020887 [Oxalis oulophora]
MNNNNNNNNPFEAFMYIPKPKLKSSQCQSSVFVKDIAMKVSDMIRRNNSNKNRSDRSKGKSLFDAWVVALPCVIDNVNKAVNEAVERNYAEMPVVAGEDGYFHMLLNESVMKCESVVGSLDLEIPNGRRRRRRQLQLSAERKRDQQEVRNCAEMPIVAAEDGYFHMQLNESVTKCESVVSSLDLEILTGLRRQQLSVKRKRDQQEVRIVSPYFLHTSTPLNGTTKNSNDTLVKTSPTSPHSTHMHHSLFFSNLRSSLTLFRSSPLSHLATDPAAVPLLPLQPSLTVSLSRPGPTRRSATDHQQVRLHQHSRFATDHQHSRSNTHNHHHAKPPLPQLEQPLA